MQNAHSTVCACCRRVLLKNPMLLGRSYEAHLLPMCEATQARLGLSDDELRKVKGRSHPTLQPFVRRLQPYVPRLQPHVPRLQPHVPRLQPHVPRLQPHVPRPQPTCPGCSPT